MFAVRPQATARLPLSHARVSAVAHSRASRSLTRVPALFLTRVLCAPHPRPLRSFTRVLCAVSRLCLRCLLPSHALDTVIELLGSTGSKFFSPDMLRKALDSGALGNKRTRTRCVCECRCSVWLCLRMCVLDAWFANKGAQAQTDRRRQTRQ